MFVCSLRLYPPDPAWGVWACVFVCALRLCPANPGCGVRSGCVCLGSGLGCAPPFLARVLGFVCLCARATRTPPTLAGVCIPIKAITCRIEHCTTLGQSPGGLLPPCSKSFIWAPSKSANS